ncbi:uncharacterized protein [Palaemon carinicauda]|uniref:uncharacterized protein n=1 Tax=Palaemon carinicauda TaxID=392227 RepID=UPI0035B688A2
MGCGKSIHRALKSLEIGKEKKNSKSLEAVQPSDVSKYTISPSSKDPFLASEIPRPSSEEERHLLDDSNIQPNSLNPQEEEAEMSKKEGAMESVHRSHSIPANTYTRQTKPEQPKTRSNITLRKPEIEAQQPKTRSDITLKKHEIEAQQPKTRSDITLRKPEIEASPVNVQNTSQTDHQQADTPKTASSIRFAGEAEKERGEEPDECEIEKRQAHRRRRMKGCRGVMARNSSGIVVKYTKVYGESDGAYKNDSTPRGLVFMVNFTKYEDDTQNEREGSEKDFNNLLNLFQQMGYETSYRTDSYCKSGYITKYKFLKMLREFSQEQRHKMLNSCVVIIMSHGSGPKTFITSDNKEVDLMEVYGMLDNLNCQNLRGKPKIFILQFCRNSPRTLPDSLNITPSLDQNYLRALIREEIQNALQYADKSKWENEIDVRSPRFSSILMKNESPLSSFRFSENSTEEQNNDESPCQGNSEEESTDFGSASAYQTDTKHVPTPPPHEGIQRFSDMYSIFSTASGELSHRDPNKGSLLIQAICHVFAEYAYQDEIDILVRKVSLYMTKTLQKDDPIHVPRQTCERTNNGLDKYFYFNPEHIPHCRHVTI